LPAAFPAVEANSESWLTYARAFCQWLAYGGLVQLSRDGVVAAESPVANPAVPSLLSGTVPVRVRTAFPQGPAGAAEELLLHLSDVTKPRPDGRRFQAAVRDLSLLGAIVLDERDRLQLAHPDLVQGGRVNKDALASTVGEMPGC